MPLPRRTFLSLLTAAFAHPAVAGSAPVVAAAASLRGVMPTLSAAFEEATGHKVRVVFGASGTLAQQIRNGAPFELFLSADEAYVTALAAEGALRDNGVVYTQGRLALIAPKGGVLAVDPALVGVRTALDAQDISRFAIAHPDHAPYGQRARETLQSADLWDALQSKLVIGENVAQAAQFAVSGNAQGGIIAASLTLSPAIAGRSIFALLPDHLHSALHQRMALSPNATAIAEALYEFVQSTQAQAILSDNGFATPEGL